MKKLLLIALAGALLPASAYAAYAHRAQMRLGDDTAARHASRGCGFAAGAAPHALVLRCSGRGGTATARYRFSTGRRLAGRAAAHVDAVRRCCTHTSVHTSVRTLEGGVVGVAVSASGPATLELKSVSLSYYVKR